VKSPRYRHRDLSEFPLEEEVVSRPPKKRVRRKKQAEAEEFDVVTWRLPERWRRDPRVGDDAMRKMTAGCRGY